MDDGTSTELERYMKYRDDPWLFLTECCFTRDAVDSENPVKLYPDYDYLRFFVRLWQREKKIAVPKSRRLTMSWTCLAMILWDCIFHKGREWATVSKKEDDSAELVSRVEFMFNHIPPDKISKSLLPIIKGGRMLKSPPKLEFDFGDITSYVAGFPMGADQLRQFTFSGIFGDECAFWPDAEEFYTGAKPTTDGGGRMILVSSRSPGFFKKIVFDKLNSKGDNFAEVPPVPPKFPIQGVEIWQNPVNKFTVIDVHYSAHPDRRSAAYKQMLIDSLPLHQYLREYERNWSTFSGLPVYPNFRKDIHVSTKRIEPVMGLPLLIGWDFGLTPSAIVGQLQKNKLLIFHEWVSQNEGIKTFAPDVMNEMKFMFPEWHDPHKDHFHFIDPAGFQRAQTDARTCAQEMEESAGIVNIEPGPVGWEKRKSSVEHFLLYIDKDGAGLQLDFEGCPILIQGFDGGYRYADSQGKVESVKPQALKDKFSHPHDALQYLCWGATQNMDNVQIDIPIPTYGFTKTENSRELNNYGRKITD